VPAEDEREFVVAERPVLVGEADAAVELGVARQSLVDAGHPDQQKTKGAAVEAVAQVLQGRWGQPVGLVDDEQVDVARCLRQVLEYVQGPLAHELPAMTDGELARVGRLVRDLHDALASFFAPAGAHWEVAIPPDAEDVVCHHDLAPWNLVLGTDRWVFIDWDGAGPGSRHWDLAYAAQAFTPLQADGGPDQDAPRLRALVDGHGADRTQRQRLPALIEAHTRGMYDLLCDGAGTGRQPWARLHAEGQAQLWGSSADYVAAFSVVFTAALAT